MCEPQRLSRFLPHNGQIPAQTKDVRFQSNRQNQIVKPQRHWHGGGHFVRIAKDFVAAASSLLFADPQELADSHPFWFLNLALRSLTLGVCQWAYSLLKSTSHVTSFRNIAMETHKSGYVAFAISYHDDVMNPWLSLRSKFATFQTCLLQNGVIPKEIHKSDDKFCPDLYMMAIGQLKHEAIINRKGCIKTQKCIHI